MPETLERNLDMVRQEWTFLFEMNMRGLDITDVSIRRCLENGLHALMITMEEVINLKESNGS